MAEVRITIKDDGDAIAVEHSCNPPPAEGEELTPAQKTAGTLLTLLDEACKKHNVTIRQDGDSSMEIPSYAG